MPRTICTFVTRREAGRTSACTGSSRCRSEVTWASMVSGRRVASGSGAGSAVTAAAMAWRLATVSSSSRSPPSSTEFSTSDRSPRRVASVSISACCGVTSRVAVRAMGRADGSLARVVVASCRRWSSARTRRLAITVSLARISRSASIWAAATE
jgi:hypothetical protein